MITGFSFKNYRAFESGEFELKPLTLLLGPNNSGKSSLLQLPLILMNTWKMRNSSEITALILNGSYASVGHTENFFHRKDVKKPVIIGVELQEENLAAKAAEQVLNKIQREINFVYLTLIRFLMSTSRDKSARRIFSEASKTAQNLLEEDFDEFTKEFFDLFIKARETRRFKPPLATDPLITKYSLTRPAELRDAHKFLQEVKNRNGKIQLEYEIKKFTKNNLLRVSSVRVRVGREVLVDVDLEKTKINCRVLKKILDLPSVNVSQIRYNIFNVINDLHALFLRDIKGIRPYNVILDFLRTIVEDIGQAFTPKTLLHVSPIRAIPQRYYFSEGQQNTGNTEINPYIVTDILKTNPNDVKKQLNHWLEKFGVKVEIEVLNELLRRISVEDKIQQIELDLPDVGFGISQVVPVVLSVLLAAEDAIVMIEQPEIHLHPQMQAELADFLIESAHGKGGEKLLVVETHSEYILYRLRRRIAEGAVRANDVALYFVERTPSGSTVRRIPINKNGGFDWPEGFSYMLEDTMGFLKKLSDE